MSGRTGTIIKAPSKMTVNMAREYYILMIVFYKEIGKMTF
jgi:hypothetical protein